LTACLKLFYLCSSVDPSSEVRTLKPWRSWRTCCDNSTKALTLLEDPSFTFGFQTLSRMCFAIFITFRPVINLKLATLAQNFGVRLYGLY
jgi:hypothetical protein